MRKNCFHKCFYLILLLSLGSLLNLVAQNDTIYLDSNFTSVNLKSIASTNKGLEILPEDHRNYYYFGFNNTFNYIDFTIKNKLNNSVKIFLEFSNPLIDEIIIYKVDNGTPETVYKTGLEYPINTKVIPHRLFSFPINLEAYKTVSYQIKLKKEEGKPLVTSAFLKSENTFIKHRFLQQIAIGLYYGVSLLSIVFSVFIFFFLRKSSYLIYALYVIFLGLFISSYTGLFSELFLPKHAVFNKYSQYVLFSEMSLILFVLFSQQILEAKKHMPKLKRSMDALLVILIIIRILLHFLFTNIFESSVPIFMNIWYGLFLVMLIIIIIELLIYYKKNNKRTSFFAMAYSFMIFGTLATILYHSYGLINTNFYGLPLLFYSSFLEILFLTFTVVLMVKEIYDERNLLSEKIVIQERKNLTAFIKGEDQERKRISKELHDNIGSQLSYLKRFISDNFKNEKAAETIDVICNDVRNLSHEISPSDLNIVGFENSVKDLSADFSKQTSIQVHFNSYQCPEHLDHDMSIQLYRVIQEALNNILKHAQAKNVNVQLMGHGNSISISIEDDGIGFNSTIAKNGIGLKNMKSRIQRIGGTISIDSQETKGTSILITLNSL